MALRSRSKLVFTLLAVGLCLAISTAVLTADSVPAATKGPAGRWQIHRAEYSKSADDGKWSSVSTLLLDSETGDTWVMWPSEKDTEKWYEWKKMARD